MRETIKTKAMAISKVPFKQGSVIVRFLTENKGMQSLMVRGYGGKKFKGVYFQALTPVEIVYQYHSEKTLHSLKEVSMLNGAYQSEAHLVQLSVTLFISELIGKCFNREFSDGEVYRFFEEINHFIKSNNPVNMPIYALAQCIDMLGVKPEFNSLNFKTAAENNLLKDLFEKTIEEMAHLNTDNKTRKILFEKLVEYLQNNIEGFGKFKSVDIIHQLLD